jgi:uncharacterized membrane protein YgdD (TMEM256/DUF423 family)
VASGAFATHALRARIDAKALEWWDTAARYQLAHAFALIATAWAEGRWGGRSPRVAAAAFTVGLVVFCGTLYAMALGGPRWLGAITPIGGTAFMVGWAALAMAARAATPRSPHA